MKRVSRGREEADAEHYRAPSSLMERPCRECHHLARAGQCGSTRRQSLPQLKELIVSSISSSISIHRVQAQREPSNNGLASGHRRLCRFAVPHRHHQDHQEQEERKQDQQRSCRRRRRQAVDSVESEEKVEQGEQGSVVASIFRTIGRGRKSWRRRRRRRDGCVAWWTQRRVTKPSISN